MRPLQLVVAAALALESPALAARPPIPTCHKNACLSRVIDGSNPFGFGECQKFFRTTVIPATVIVTKTVAGPTDTVSFTTHPKTTKFVTSTVVESDTFTSTTTTTIIGGGVLAERAKPNKPITTSQTTLPSYASGYCANTAQYSSACSCIRASHRTTTLNAPTSKTTATIGSTTSDPIATVTRTVKDVVETDTTTSYIATTLVVVYDYESPP